jgi:3-(3-hydroxy-phenyl)propionate hydroxylase
LTTAANLCWKLAAVVKGQAPDSLLDSYQAERQPHVTDVTRRACRVGRIITERNRVIAAVRNHSMRALTRLPGALRVIEKLFWIPDARYKNGFFAAGHRATGWQIPQPWVVDRNGSKVRLDDVLGGQWTILHTGAVAADAQSWMELGVPAIRITEPALTRWLQRKKATTVVLRPDGFIYGASGSGSALPPPPAGFTVSSPVSSLTEIGARP